MVLPRPTTAFETIRRQALGILQAQGIPPDPALRLLTAFAQEALKGPYRGSRRFSAINLDGLPFQWSVSLGNAAGGFRFIADCGVPGQSISERITHTLEAVLAIAPALGLCASIAPLNTALASLLADAAVMNASLMGLCVGVDVDPRGAVSLKLYVNTETGHASERFERVSRCLVNLGRATAALRLRSLSRTLADRLTPAFTAIDLTPGGIGRLKLYFRPTDGCPELASLAGEIVGCLDTAEQLAPFHAAFLDGASYPPAAVHISVEFPPEGCPTGIKFDLYASGLFRSDTEVDRRILTLLAALSFDDGPYRSARNVVAGSLSAELVRCLLFAGLAIRGGGRRVNVYLHPFPGGTDHLAEAGGTGCSGSTK